MQKDNAFVEKNKFKHEEISEALNSLLTIEIKLTSLKRVVLADENTQATVREFYPQSLSAFLIDAPVFIKELEKRMDILIDEINACII